MPHILTAAKLVYGSWTFLPKVDQRVDNAKAYLPNDKVRVNTLQSIDSDRKVLWRKRRLALMALLLRVMQFGTRPSHMKGQLPLYSSCGRVVSSLATTSHPNQFAVLVIVNYSFAFSFCRFCQGFSLFLALSFHRSFLLRLFLVVFSLLADLREINDV